MISARSMACLGVVVSCLFASITPVMSQATFSILPSNTITDTADCGISSNWFTVYISNPSAKDLHLSYTVVSSTMPSDVCWEYGFCDWTNCILTLPTGTTTPDTLQPIPANNQNCPCTSKMCLMKLDISPKNYKGQGSLVIKLFETSDSSNSQTITWNITGCPSGTVCNAGIFETSDNADFLVFPNPAEEYINVDITDGYQPGGSILIYNLVGEKLLEYPRVKNRTLKVDLTTFPAGAYFVKYDSGTGESVKNFLKVK